MTVLLICWVMFTLFLMSKDEKILHFRQLSVSEGAVKSEKDGSVIEVSISNFFLQLTPSMHRHSIPA